MLSTRIIQRIMAPFQLLLHVTTNRDADSDTCGTTWQRLKLLYSSWRTKNDCVHTENKLHEETN